MFSYTDDAIVTSSPTGRHLSTVIRRPCVLMSGWNEHAEAICKVLNELDRAAKASRLCQSIHPGALVYEQIEAMGEAREELKTATVPSIKIPQTV